MVCFEDKALSWSNVFICFDKLKSDRELVDSDSWSDTLPTSITNENIAKSRTLMRFDRRLTIREMAVEFRLNFYGIRLILTEDLKVCSVGEIYSEIVIRHRQVSQELLNLDGNASDSSVSCMENFAEKEAIDSIEDIQANKKRVFNTFKKENFQEHFHNRRN